MAEDNFLSNEVTGGATPGSVQPKLPAEEVEEVTDFDFFTLQDLDLAMTKSNSTANSCDDKTLPASQSLQPPRDDPKKSFSLPVEPPRTKKLVKLKVSELKCSYCGQEFVTVAHLNHHHSTQHAGNQVSLEHVITI